MPTAFISVIIFLVLMHKILFKPLSQYMETRAKGIEDDLATAAHLRQQAETGLTSYEAALAAARRELAEHLATAQRATEAKQREIIEQARREADGMVAEAQATITREAEEARLRLTADTRDLAQRMVAKLLGRSMRQ
jgi:F-type H+-transporting ATPase subunit b